MITLVQHLIRHRLEQIRILELDPERGASVVETVIITAAFAALAIAVMAAIVLLVNGKVSGIQL